MARKSSSTISQEELYPLSDETTREELDDARLLDLDVEEESPFLRAQTRVSVRRGSLPRKTATRLLWAAVALGVLFLCGVGAAALYHYAEHSWRFRIDSSDDIQLGGLQSVTRAQVMEVMGGDIGRNIFFVPLAQRKAQLEQIPWVESASVMRFVPNRLRVEIHERTPVAFSRVGSQILLVDAGGTLMELPPKRKYSFPVIIGMNPGEPLSTRAARMKIYKDVTTQLDSGGARYSQDLSEVDISDPDDVKVLASHTDGVVLVHLGSGNYLDRYKVYVAHVQEWRQQFDKLESVDLRYDRQIIVNPDLQRAAKPAPLSASAARRAMAAGVKPAALITHGMITVKPRPAAVVTATGPVPARQIAKKKTVRAGRRKKSAKRLKAAKTGVPASSAKAADSSASAPRAAAVPSNASQSKPVNAKPSPAIAKEQEP